MFVSVLGPLHLEVDGAAVVVPGAMRRAVLALLAMAAPEPITRDSLIDALWPDDPPVSASAALQSHVSRLRRHLGSAADRLATTPHGYRLDLRAHELDAARMHALVQQARDRKASDPAAAAHRAEQARQLWRGRPLAGLDDIAALASWGRRLTETWLTACDIAAESSLALGDPSRAILAAEAARSVEPLRETSVVLTMRALAADGRAAEALRTANDYRRLLADETGLDPTPALTAAEHAAAAGTGARSALRAPATAHAHFAPPTALIGRDREVAGLERLLESERMVTIVGPGGVGKTHLALSVAQRAGAARPVTVLALAPVSDPRAVPVVLARALGLQVAAADATEMCAQRLSGEDHLLVIDNCEHLRSAVADLATSLLATCPELRVFATSRERIAVAAEQVCPLAPLPMPADDDDLARAEAVPSVALFIQRARRARADAISDPDDVAAACRVARRLDGIPLAIELAAGRLSSMSIRDLEARLDRALDLLAAPGPHSYADGRHRTLRAAVEWSYDLLDADGRRLFRHLAMFADGFDLTTAELLAAELEVTTDPARCLAGLVDASMVEVTFEPATRYRMLDTLRAFGLDRLTAAGETDDADRRLIRWAVGVSAWLSATVWTDEPRADRRLRTELGNLRVAWRRMRDRGDLDSACELVVNLYDLTAWRDTVEIWSWAMELGTDPALDGHPSEVAALGVAAEGTWFTTGDLDRAADLAQRGLALAAARGNESDDHCCFGLGDVLLLREQFADAAAMFERVAEMGSRPAEGWAMAAMAHTYGGRHELARALLRRAGEHPAPSTLRAFIEFVHGEIDRAEGQWIDAQARYRRALDAAVATGATFLQGIVSVSIVTAHAAAGDVAAALHGYRELIDYWERTGGWTQQWTTLRNLADLLDTLGDTGTATSLRAAADTSPESAGTRQVVTLGTAADRAASRAAALAVARDAISTHVAALEP